MYLAAISVLSTLMALQSPPSVTVQTALVPRQNQTTQAAAAQHLKRAQDAFLAGRAKEAIDRYNDANKLLGGKCAECYMAMAVAYIHLGNYKKAIESSDRVLELPLSDEQRAEVHDTKGEALAVSDRKNRFREAEAEYHQAVSLNPQNPLYVFHRGISRLKQNNDEGGVADLEQYLSTKPSGPLSELAVRLIRRPGCARETCAPDLIVETPTGQAISIEALRGKIILLNFWMAGCEKCFKALSAMNGFLEKYRQEVVVLSINTDLNDGEWREFIDRYKFTWPQARLPLLDAVRVFGRASASEFVLIDQQGIIRKVLSGVTDPTWPSLLKPTLDNLLGK